MNLSGKTILFLVTEDWYFCSHRIPIARAAKDAGARVIVASRINRHRDVITSHGFEAVDLPFDRSGLNPLKDMGTVQAITDLYRREQPDLVHQVAMKPVLYGSIAARRAGVGAVVNAMAGMGFLFISNSLKARLLRGAVKTAFRWLNNRPGTRLILQNGDDAALFEREIGVRSDHLAIIRGSGVDITRFTPAATEPDGPPVALCVSRMLWDKGIGELVEAARLLKARGTDIRIQLVGPTDDNPASIPEATLQQWAAEGVVEVCGPSDDIPGACAGAHMAVLPSYREGLPKSLLEAAAAGLPMVATDVTGCREVCREGETGLLVPLKSVGPLADALEKLAGDPALRKEYGANARKAAETEFADTAIAAQTLALYDQLLG